MFTMAFLFARRVLSPSNLKKSKLFFLSSSFFQKKISEIDKFLLFFFQNPGENVGHLWQYAVYDCIQEDPYNKERDIEIVC